MRASFIYIFEVDSHAKYEVDESITNSLQKRYIKNVDLYHSGSSMAMPNINLIWASLTKFQATQCSGSQGEF